MNHCMTGASAFALIVGMISTPALATDLYEAPARARSVTLMETWSRFYSGRPIGGVFGQEQDRHSSNGQPTRLTLRTLGGLNA
jgi:hypothetical protein